MSFAPQSSSLSCALATFRLATQKKAESFFQFAMKGRAKVDSWLPKTFPLLQGRMLEHRHLGLSIHIDTQWHQNLSAVTTQSAQMSNGKKSRMSIVQCTKCGTYIQGRVNDNLANIIIIIMIDQAGRILSVIFAAYFHSNKTVLCPYLVSGTRFDGGGGGRKERREEEEEEEVLRY